MSHTSKLAELRSKTDRQLIALMRGKLDRELASARASEQVYSEARALLPTLRDVTPAERRRLEWKLSRLGALLNRPPADAAARAHAACS